MVQFAKKNALFLLMVFLCIPLTLSATWVVELLGLPLIVSRILAIIVYLPFCCFVGIKVIFDLRHWRTAITFSNGCYYIFAVYYAAVLTYRFLNHMEVKENLYFSIIFFGSIALYMLLRDRCLTMTAQGMLNNLVWIALFFIAYRLLYCLIGARFLEFSPININLTSGAVALLLPVIGQWLADKELTRGKQVLCWLTVVGSIAVIATTGARALFWLMVIIVVISLLSHIGNKQGLLRLGSAVLAGCLVVAVLCIANVGRTRYALYRQTGITLHTSGTSDPNGDDPDSMDSDDKFNEDQLIAQEQATASDQMRSELVALGLEQIRINPWFGTGDVMYVSYPREDFKAVQSSHNFLIEAIICYGVIGLVMIACLFVALIGETGLFVKKGKDKRTWKIALLLTLFFYFAFGFVQPTVFNVIICLLFVMSVVSCREFLQDDAAR